MWWIYVHNNRLLLLIDFLRAFPRVCQNLLGKFCVLPTSKQICQVKKPYLTLWHNSFAKPRSNLHQEYERETKLCLYSPTSWKLTLGILLYYYLPLHLSKNHDANHTTRVYISAPEAIFSQVAKYCQVFCQTKNLREFTKFYLGKSYILCQVKKRVHFQKFDIIHLSNSVLTYIRNPKRETKLCLWFSTSWKLASGTLLYSLFFHPPTWLCAWEKRRC
jgi:hypothetical protein